MNKVSEWLKSWKKWKRFKSYLGSAGWISKSPHSRSSSTLEGGVVRLSDKIAYINHDIDDAIRAKMFEEKDLPFCYTDVLGHSVRERLNIMIHDIILNSLVAGDLYVRRHGRGHDGTSPVDV